MAGGSDRGDTGQWQASPIVEKPEPTADPAKQTNIAKKLGIYDLFSDFLPVPKLFKCNAEE